MSLQERNERLFYYVLSEVLPHQGWLPATGLPYHAMLFDQRPVRSVCGQTGRAHPVQPTPAVDASAASCRCCFIA